MNDVTPSFWDQFGYLLTSPIFLLMAAFQIWMLVDAIRQREWMWVLIILVFSGFGAIYYYFTVYRTTSSGMRGFELPGAHDRKRIKELEAQIHHLDKAHHYSQLGDIYLNQGKLAKAEACYRSALERDPQDIDTRAHLGQCLLRQKKAAEARPWLQAVCTENQQHDYGHTLMAYAETLAALGETDNAIVVWERVTETHSYARARVQLAELYLAKHQPELARAQLQEVISEAPHSPAFERKRERVWVRRAKRLMRRR